MKKAIVILLALLAIGSLYAADASPWTLTGNAWVKWGVDLGTKMHGFNNGYDLEFDYKLADVKGGAAGEGVYGKIDITDLELNISADDTVGAQPALDAFDGSVSASIVAGALTVGVYGTPSFTFNNAAFIEPYSKDGYDDLSSSAKSKIRATQSLKGGTYVKYSLGALGSVEARVASVGDWGATAATAAGASTTTYVDYVAAGTEVTAAAGDYYLAGVPVGAGVTLTAGNLYQKKTVTAGAAAVASSASDKYLFAGYATLTPISMITVNAGFMMNPDTKYTGFTGKLTLKPITDLTVTAGLDGVKATSTADLQMDIGGSVAYKLNEGKDTVSANFYYANDKANATTYARLDAALKIADAQGFVPNLTADVGVFANDLLADPAWDPMKLAIAEKVTYKVVLSDTSSVGIYEKYATNLNAKTAYLNVGADLKMIANTTITVDYVYGSIADDVVGNAFVNGAAADIAKGKFSVKAKVAF